MFRSAKKKPMGVGKHLLGHYIVKVMVAIVYRCLNILSIGFPRCFAKRTWLILCRSEVLLAVSKGLFLGKDHKETFLQT